MNSTEIRSRFLTFFQKRGHAILPSASLITPDEKGVTNSTLFNTAGMQPLVPYLLGKPHPSGTRLADSQKCVRTIDIEDVGDNTHATFFEMLGNWSLGDYFKKEAITWSYEFLTSQEEGLGLDPQRLYVTVFEGDLNAPRDTESYDIWKALFEKNGVTGERIYYMGAKSNWWSAGDNGPCGPDTEMFYDVTGTLTFGMTRDEYMKADDERRVVEIWNDVFMEYEKKDGKVVGKLPKKNVDTGSGLERVTLAVQGKSSIYETDVLSPLMDCLAHNAKRRDTRAERILCDHIRTSVFMIGDGLTPANSDRGYILRRLLRRAILYIDMLGLPHNILSTLTAVVAETYKGIYPNLLVDSARIQNEILVEEAKFRQTLDRGVRELEKILLKNKKITGKEAFDLFQSFGFPKEFTKEVTLDIVKNMQGAGVGELHTVFVHEEQFDEEMKKHQDLSRSGSEAKFKGGLSGHGETEVRYHTATHLLHQALRTVLGTHVEQKGSNITPERLRFDFTHSAKMTDGEKKRVEDIVNEQIKKALPVHRVELPFAEAEKTGALHFFGDKYGDTVSVYYVGDSLDSAFSKEFCGGPHVKNTSEIGTFKIQKEEASSAGVRRIKAIVG